MPEAAGVTLLKKVHSPLDDFVDDVPSPAMPFRAPGSDDDVASPTMPFHAPGSDEIGFGEVRFRVPGFDQRGDSMPSHNMIGVSPDRDGRGCGGRGEGGEGASDIRDQDTLVLDWLVVIISVYRSLGSCMQQTQTR